MALLKLNRYLVMLFVELLCLLDMRNCAGILARLRTTDDSLMSQQIINPSKKCYTTTCRNEASSIYKRLGGYFKPCDNFFLYTCGGFFMKENGLSDMENLQEKISNIIYDELLSKEVNENETYSIKNAKYLFESCKNRDETFYAEFKAMIIKDLDGWPLLGDQYYVSDTKLKTSNNDSSSSEEEEVEISADVRKKREVHEDEENDTEETTSSEKTAIEETKETKVSPSSITETLTETETETSSTATTSRTEESTSTSSESAKKDRLYEKLIKFFRLGINPFFRIDVDVNPFDNSKFAIWIRRPVSIRFKSHAIIEANLKYFLKRLVVFLNSSCPIESVDKQVDGTIRLETAFNSLNKKNSYSPPIINMTIQELITELPEFDWNLFLVDKVFRDTFNMTVNLSQSIIIHDIDNLKRAVEIFKNETAQHRRDVENFLVWELVKSMMQYFPNIETNKANSTTKSNGAENKTAAMCSRYVTVHLNFLVSKYFIEKQADAETLKGAIQMIESIRTEFISMINENEWMDKTSKQKAVQKLNNMVFKVAYPDYIMNDTLMNDIYKTFKFDRNEFLNNDLLIKRITNLISFEYLNHEVHRESWKFGPALANAAYYTLMNEIYIPVGIIQPPFYNKDTLMMFNYARLGSIIGHEIAHGFDSEGRKFDHYGNFHSDETSPWNISSIRVYKNKSECFVRHYSNYTIANLAQKLNGIQTLEENISDNMGFKAAYRAYKKWVATNGEEKSLPDLMLNHDQLYFIAYAQTLCEFDTFKFVLEQNHSPNEIRLYGVVSNMKEFTNAFNCTQGDFHNPNEQCSIW